MKSKFYIFHNFAVLVLFGWPFCQLQVICQLFRSTTSPGWRLSRFRSFLAVSRRRLKEHLLANLWYVTGRLSTNWDSAPWLAVVLLRRGPCHLYLWSDWLEKQCKALMVARLPPLHCLYFCYFSSFALDSLFCNCDIINRHTCISAFPLLIFPLVFISVTCLTSSSLPPHCSCLYH